VSTANQIFLIFGIYIGYYRCKRNLPYS